uniref:Uncharacterized protein n=1 Tax=Arundo donax TaxID=35708 RepID=A0A0A8XYA0_ARUDO
MCNDYHTSHSNNPNFIYLWRLLIIMLILNDSASNLNMMLIYLTM